MVTESVRVPVSAREREVCPRIAAFLHPTCYMLRVLYVMVL